MLDNVFYLGWLDLNLQLNNFPKTLAVSAALSPETWPFSLHWLPPSACLVGGTVRDALLDRHSEYLDLDFVLPTGAVETAQAIAQHYRAGFVVLDPERQIARVVFEQGTVDFAQQVGDSLEADLRRRDFTVNAIAYCPYTAELFDPLQGYRDLQDKCLRMVSAENLAEDPLRLLRAHRQAAQLGFTLEAETQATIRQLAPHLRQIAAERVQSELNYLLSSTPRGTDWLRSAWADGLLAAWLPEATEEGLSRIADIDHAAVLIQEGWPEFWAALNCPVRGSSAAETARRAVSSAKAPEASPTAGKAPKTLRTWVTIAKLACLLPADPATAETRLWRLKYSRAEIQAARMVVNTVRQALPQLHQGSPKLDWSLAEQYHFFQAVGGVFPAIALYTIAGQIFSQIAILRNLTEPIGANPLPCGVMTALIERFLNPDDPVAHPLPILTGQDLMGALKLQAGPLIGRLLAALQLARAEGSITTREQALELAQELVQQDCW